MNTLADKYYIKALDQYPFNLEEAIENLNYALSYNDEHTGANYLMGKVHQEHLEDFSKAEFYYVRALAGNPNDLNVCMAYISLLIAVKQFEKAQKLITYSNKLKGVDLARTYSLEALISENKRDYENALLLLKDAKLEAYNQDCIDYLDKEIKRVKMKKKLINKSSQNEKQEAA